MNTVAHLASAILIQKRLMPLVLTTNDVVLNPDHAWNDITGVQYHYPNQYKNKIRTGEPFVYYRGVHRKDGPRGQAEYFGHGRIGEIRQDPATMGSSRPSWFCTIEDYVPFTPPVPAKPDGVFYEQIAPNMWRNGVRTLDQDVLERIIAAAGSSTGTSAPTIIPPPSTPQAAENLIVPRGKAAGGGGNGGYRKSKRAKEVGDWAERAALAFIRHTLNPATLVHRAAQAETPGWDIDYVDSSGELQRVEVKGTVSAAFTSIDFTAGELRAAQTHGDKFWLYLVANCLTDRAQVQAIQNPAARLAEGDWTARPILFNILLG